MIPSPTRIEADRFARWFPYGAPARDGRVNLLCLPYAGGGASLYRRWIDAFGSGVAVVPIQLPGREERFAEAPFTRMDELIPALLAVLGSCSETPLILFGYSMGASIAYQLAHGLRAAGPRAPDMLMVAARRAPHFPQRAPILHDLPSEEFWKGLERLGGTPPTIARSREMRELFEPLLRADFALTETYQAPAGEPLAMPLAAFGGDRDPIVGEAELAAWRDRTSGEFTLTRVPGGHFVLAEDALIDAVGERLRTALVGR